MRPITAKRSGPRLDAGYILARGDRRDFCIVDPAGDEHSLGKRLVGARAADVRAYMAEVDRGSLPSVAEARELARARPEEGGAEGLVREEGPPPVGEQLPYEPPPLGDESPMQPPSIGELEPEPLPVPVDELAPEAPPASFSSGTEEEPPF